MATTPAGRREHPIKIVQRKTDKDGHGQPIEGDFDLDTPVAECFADVNPKPGRAQSAAAQHVHPQSTVFRILYRPGITSNMGVVHRGEVYRVDDVVDVGLLNEELDLVTTRFGARS